MRFTHRQLREAFHLLFLERLLKLTDPRLYALKGDATKVEFSRVSSLVGREGVWRFRCQHYSGQAAAAQKLSALVNRSEPQVRDAFDLYLLWLGDWCRLGHLIERLVPAGPIKCAIEPRLRCLRGD